MAAIRPRARQANIEKLDLDNKGVGVPGALVLSCLLPASTALKMLKCACLLMTDLIKCQQPLTALCLTLVRSVSRNRMGSEGAKAFGEALKTNSTLEVLEYATPPLMTDHINCQ